MAPHFVPSVTNTSVGAKCHTRADFGHVRPLPKILEVPQVFLCLVDVGIGFFILIAGGDMQRRPPGLVRRQEQRGPVGRELQQHARHRLAVVAGGEMQRRPT